MTRTTNLTNNSLEVLKRLSSGQGVDEAQIDAAAKILREHAAAKQPHFIMWANSYDIFHYDDKLGWFAEDPILDEHELYFELDEPDRKLLFALGINSLEPQAGNNPLRVWGQIQDKANGKTTSITKQYSSVRKHSVKFETEKLNTKIGIKDYKIPRKRFKELLRSMRNEIDETEAKFIFTSAAGFPRPHELDYYPEDVQPRYLVATNQSLAEMEADAGDIDYTAGKKLSPDFLTALASYATQRVQPTTVFSTNKKYYLLFVSPQTGRKLLASKKWHQYQQDPKTAATNGLPADENFLGQVDNILVIQSDLVPTFTKNNKKWSRALLFGKKAMSITYHNFEVPFYQGNGQTNGEPIYLTTPFMPFKWAYNRKFRGLSVDAQVTVHKYNGTNRNGKPRAGVIAIDVYEGA